MGFVNLKQCDVYHSVKHVESYRVDLLREIPDGALHVLQEWHADLSPRALKRLMRFIKKGCIAPREEITDDGESGS